MFYRSFCAGTVFFAIFFTPWRLVLFSLYAISFQTDIFHMDVVTVNVFSSKNFLLVVAFKDLRLHGSASPSGAALILGH
jgi:hypothetical protein